MKKKLTRKERILCGFFAVFFLVSATLFSVEAASAYSWYCPHVANHARPETGAELRFVKEYGGYYLGADEKVIYLTFDAGYENGNVAKILDVLKEENVPGAFFVLGNLITRNPDLVRRMTDEGHTVCNHTVHHRNMSSVPGEELLSELHELEVLYEKTTGKPMAKFYRPPEGRFSEANLKALSDAGYKTIFWSFAYPDWDNNKQINPERAKNMILANAHSGEVMLLHPTSSTNAAVLGDVIRALKNEGYRFGTIEELTK